MPLRKRLLIVDDEPGTRILLSQIFRSMGHDVACVADGIAALHRIREWMPDIILSDLNMPGMSGFELLSVVRRRLPEIFVIATSGAYSGTAVPEGIAADAFYEKATGLAKLFQIVDEADPASIAEKRRTKATVPVWISVDTRHPTEGGYVAVGCPECLRVFTYVPVNSTGLVHRESCIYCCAQVHYAIVKVMSPVSELKYQSVLGAQLSARHDFVAST